MPGRSVYLEQLTDWPLEAILPAQNVAAILVEKRLDEWVAQKWLRSGISHVGEQEARSMDSA